MSRKNKYFLCLFTLLFSVFINGCVNTSSSSSSSSDSSQSTSNSSNLINSSSSSSSSINNSTLFTDFNARYIETGHNNVEPDYEIINDKANLKDYYEKNKAKYNLENDIYGNGFLNVCSLYEDSFFKENALVLIVDYVGTNAQSLLIKSYETQNKTLIVNIENKKPIDVDGAAIIVSYHIFLEVPKSNIENIYDVKIMREGVWRNEPPKERLLSCWYPFLDNIKYEDIKEVQLVDYLGSVVPGCLQYTKFSNDKNDISNILSYFKQFKLSLVENTNEIPEMKPGYAAVYYAFVTDEKIYSINLDFYFHKKTVYYKADYMIPQMENGIEANNILDHSIKHDVYFNTRGTPFVFDEISNLSSMMIKEYDNGNKYYMSDELYIDFNGAKIRIIDFYHFEYNFKYYEIIGEVDLSDIYVKSLVYSARLKSFNVSIYYSSLEEFDSVKEATYVAHQTISVNEIKSILNDDRPYAYLAWYLYLDEECTIPFEDTKIEDNMVIYATNINPNGNNQNDVTA